MIDKDRKEILYKEIDLIQSCISRMSQNSFMVKGWLLSLIAVILALLPENVNISILCLISFIVIACFWYLDAFFLKIERLYRWKYNWVIMNRLKSEDFIFDLNPHNSKMWLKSDFINESQNSTPILEPCIIRVMFTRTLIPLYIPLIILVIITYIVNAILR